MICKCVYLVSKENTASYSEWLQCKTEQFLLFLITNIVEEITSIVEVILL